MLNIALTGNVASGKSTVAKLFASWGATIIDSDALVAEEQKPGSDMLAAISHQFGDSLILEDGSLDRARLRRLVFADESARAKLNAIVHPAIRSRRDALLAEARRRGDRIVISDIPLLFEVLDPSTFDIVILVEAPKSIRHKRLLDRGLSESEADLIMASQMPSSEKRERSDIVIENSGTIENLENAAHQAWKTITGRADA